MNKKLFGAFACTLAMLALTSCGTRQEDPTPKVEKPKTEEPKKEDPQKQDPKPEEPKQEEPKTPSDPFQPKSVSLAFLEGHMHGQSEFHYLALSNNIKHAKLDQTTKLSRGANDVWTPEAEQPRRWVVSSGLQRGKDAPSPAYGLWIEYFDASGQNINDQIAKGTAADEYQHFFYIKDLKPTKFGKVEAEDQKLDEAIRWTYRDSDPWNGVIKKKTGKLIGDKNPLGLKGFFSFHRPYKTFTLVIELRRFEAGAKLKDGARQFNKPEGKLVHKIEMPMICFRQATDEFQDANEDFDIEPDESIDPSDAKAIRADIEKKLKALIDRPMDAYDEADRRIGQLYMDAYGITWADFLRDYYERVYGEGESEGAGRYH